MKKSLETQLQKIFGKLYTVSLELTALRNDLEEEHAKLEETFQEVEEKYDNTDEPSDALERRYQKAEEDFDEIDNAFSSVDMANDSLDSCIEELIDALPPELVQEMKDAIDGGKKQNVTLPKKELKMKRVAEMKMKVVSFLEDNKTGEYRLNFEVTTNIQPKARKMCFRWNGEAWKTTPESEELPYLHEAAIPEYQAKEQQLLAMIWEKRKTQGIFGTVTFNE